MLSMPDKYISGKDLTVHTRTFLHTLERSLLMCSHRFYVCCYVLTANRRRQSDPVLNLLNRCSLMKIVKGIDVRFAIDLPVKKTNNWNCNHSFMRFMHENEIPFRCPDTMGTLHAKMIIVDDTVVYIGSHNLAMSSLKNPLEITVGITDSEVVEKCAIDFQKWWSTLIIPPIRAGV